MTRKLSDTPRLVVIATDGADESAGAIRTGVALAGAYNARLLGVSVAPDDPEYSTLVPNLAEMAEESARVALQAFRDAAGAPVETEIRDDTDAANGIVAAATERDADLIVMGRHTKGEVARRLVGTTTSGVIGGAPCPVLVVPRAARLWERRVLVASDGSPDSLAATDAAGSFGAQAGLPVSVVSVVTESHSEARRQEAEQVVAAAVAQLQAQGLAVDGVVVEGRPGEAIVKAAEEAGADLIVLGSRGRTGLSKVLMGSVAESVIGSAAIPVLVVKS